MDPFRLQRFVDAQQYDYAVALSELQSGRKCSHWMWYIFPQLKGLGRSETADYYGISSIEEAEAYLNHPVLGARLIEAAEAVALHGDKSAEAIMGFIDAMKLRSSMTLFHAAAPDIPVFQNVLEFFYQGEPDDQTLHILGEL